MRKDQREDMINSLESLQEDLLYYEAGYSVLTKLLEDAHKPEGFIRQVEVVVMGMNYYKENVAGS